MLSQDDCGEFAPVIYAPGAHEGVAGIVAGGLKEELGKPVCIVSPSKDGSLKGTGRSISGLNLHELFESCGDVFERFGGHAGACGFTVKDGCLEEFRQRLQDLVKIKANENPSILEKTIYIEKELSRDEMTLDFAECLKQLEPFGEANPVPIFCIRNAIVSDVRFLGSDGQHIRFSARANGKSIVCIAFGKSSDFAPILRSGVVDIAGELCINEFRGNKQLQMRVADLKAV